MNVKLEDGNEFYAYVCGTGAISLQVLLDRNPGKTLESGGGSARSMRSGGRSRSGSSVGRSRSRR